jgi:hypothetical protein
MSLVLTLDDVKKLQPPMAVLCFNPGAFFSYAVQGKTHGPYGHFMWLVGENEFASQSWWFQSVPVSKYQHYYMKFVYNPNWTDIQKSMLVESLRKDLAKPKWETRYDVLALVGHLVGLKWIQSKNFEICSDTADHLKNVDNRYDLKAPTPEDVNQFFKSHAEYVPYGVYTGGDI